MRSSRLIITSRALDFASPHKLSLLSPRVRLNAER